MLAGATGAAATAAMPAEAPAPPTVAGCPAFPASSAWNRRVDALPVARDSARLVASIGLDRGLHADFGSGLWEGKPIGIPVTVVRRATPRTKVAFDYANESDRIAYPIPAAVRIEGGSDRHAILVDRDACRLYELYALRRAGQGWAAGSGATWDLRSNRQRPAGWTSADAAGLPILPGLARPEEALGAGGIRHPLRFTAPATRRAYVARNSTANTEPPPTRPSTAMRPPMARTSCRQM